MIGILVLLVAIVAAFIVIKAVSGIIGFIIMVGIWMLTGFVAGKLIRGRGYGPIGNALLGLGGGLIGSLVLRLIGVSFGDIWIVSNVIVGVIGAAILIFGLRLLGNEDFAA